MATTATTIMLTAVVTDISCKMAQNPRFGCLNKSYSSNNNNKKKNTHRGGVVVVVVVLMEGHSMIAPLPVLTAVARATAKAAKVVEREVHMWLRNCCWLVVAAAVPILLRVLRGPLALTAKPALMLAE